MNLPYWELAVVFLIIHVIAYALFVVPIRGINQRVVLFVGAYSFLGCIVAVTLALVEWSLS